MKDKQYHLHAAVRLEDWRPQAFYGNYSKISQITKFESTFGGAIGRTQSQRDQEGRSAVQRKRQMPFCHIKGPFEMTSSPT